MTPAAQPPYEPPYEWLRALAGEVYQVLVDADSLASLVAYRYPRALPADVVADLKALSTRARALHTTARPT